MATQEKTTSANFNELMGDYEVEAIEMWAKILKTQQKAALELTRLVLDYTKQEKMTKDRVFAIFKESLDCIRKNSVLPL